MKYNNNIYIYMGNSTWQLKILQFVEILHCHCDDFAVPWERWSLLWSDKWETPVFSSNQGGIKQLWFKILFYLYPKCSMYWIFANIYPQNHPNVGKYGCDWKYYDWKLKIRFSMIVSVPRFGQNSVLSPEIAVGPTVTNRKLVSIVIGRLNFKE